MRAKTFDRLAAWRLILIFAALLILAVSLILVPAPVAHAGTQMVNITADTFDGICNVSDCSLRDAISAASPGDTIVFSLTLPATIVLTTSSPLIVSKNLTINGPGLDLLTVSGNNTTQVFNLNANVAITDLTIRNGNASASYGGGILVNSGSVTITNSSIISNATGSGGGGIAFFGSRLLISNTTISMNSANSGSSGAGIYVLTGTVTITQSNVLTNTSADGSGVYNNVSGVVNATNSSISGNSATSGGGGIRNYGKFALMNSLVFSNNAANSGGGINSTGVMTISTSTIYSNTSTNPGAGIGNFGAMTITQSTISKNNSSSDGGGIRNGGPLTITNSTISGNAAVSVGGGISNLDTLVLNNVTLTKNSAAGLYAGPGTTSLKNSIIAGNAPASSPDCSGTVTSLGYNLIGDGTNCTGPVNGVNGDIVGTGANPVDPKLALLANWGGSTQTHGLYISSPAINAGNPGNPILVPDACAVTDQRGVVRPIGECDIGAFEGSLQPLYLPLILK